MAEGSEGGVVWEVVGWEAPGADEGAEVVVEGHRGVGSRDCGLKRTIVMGRCKMRADTCKEGDDVEVGV